MYKIFRPNQLAPVPVPDNRWWCVGIEDGKYIKIVKSFPTYAEAEEYVNSVK